MADLSELRPTARPPARVGTGVCFGATLMALVASCVVSGRLGWFLRGGIGLAVVLACLLAGRRSHRAGPNPWIFIGAGVAMWGTAYLLRDIVTTGSGHWSDAMALLGYVAIGIGLAVIAQLRSDRPSRIAFLDASVVAIAAAMLLWAFWVTPSGTSTSIVDRLVFAAYPLGDGILVTILGWMALVPGRKSRALEIIGVSVALVLGADLVQQIGQRVHTDLSAATAPVAFLAYALIGFAALRSDRRMRLAAPTPDDSSGDTSRLVLLGVALLVGPAVSITADTSTTEGVVFVSVCSALLATGVIARFVNLIHENRLAHEATTTSERRFRLLADSAPVGIFEVARGMRVTYANREGKGVFGTEVVGIETSALLDQVDPTSRERLATAMQAVERGTPAKADVKLLGTGDRWVSWRGVPVTAQGPHLPAAFVSTLDITQLKHAEAALGRQATHDPLTGLPNRRLLLESLITALQALGRGHRTGTVALMFIDLDQFKIVNDVLGHDAGDELLKTASARLRNAVRNHDMVARFGGDEFVVLMEHVSDRGELHDVAQRILDALHEPIVVAGSPAKVGASVGIATASGPDDDPDALIRNADAAMYRAKEHGRGRYEFFRPDAKGQLHRTL